MFSFKLFPSSKIDVWPFLKLQKMDFGEKIFFVKLIYLTSRVFWPGFFKIFWPTMAGMKMKQPLEKKLNQHWMHW